MSEVMDVAPPPIAPAKGGDREDPVYFCEDCPFRGAASARLADIVSRRFSWGTGVEAAGLFIDDDKNVSEVFNLPAEDATKSHKDFDREFDEQVCFDLVKLCEAPEVRKSLILRREIRQCPALFSFVPKNLRKELKKDAQSKRWSK